MRIRTKLLINIVLPVVTVLVIILVMISTIQKVEEAQKETDITVSLLTDIFDLSQRTDYYLLYGEERTKTEWYSVHDSMVATTSQTDFKNAEQNQALQRIRRGLREMKALFTQLSTGQESADQARNQEKMDRLSGLILVRARDISSDALQLFHTSRQERDGHIKNGTITVLLSLILSLLASLSTLLPMNRTIAKSLSTLRSGVALIAAGNLRHKTGLRRQDELGDLSRSFDDMTERLEAITVFKDELERKVVERTETLQRQADLLELAHSAILVIDGENRITFWNRAAEEMYGWTKAEAQGKLIRSLLSTQYPVSYQQYVSTLTREGRWEGELIHTTKDGRQINVLSRQALQNDARNSRTIMQINLDTTDARQMEQHLRQAQKQEALGTLAGGIAHDFNNILAAIVGFTELLHDRLPENSRENRYAKRILEASLRARDLVKQMLTFSRRTEGEKKPLRLSSIVKETAKLLRASIPSTVSIQVNVQSESGVILGSPIEIQQVVMNLGTNAAHAMREKGGVLDIELSDFSVPASNGNPHGIEPGFYMRLVVRDTGTGISPEVMDKIFDPFFTTKGQGEGTGLGLSVVMGIVNQCHGYITAESQLGEGSTFSVYFPKVEQEPKTLPMVGQEPLSRGNERILFVDDEEAIVEMGEEMLAELGYEVTCQTSSRQALALFRLDPSRFDLVITDQTMPDITGMELASEMLVIRPDLPIILATGFSHVVNAEKAKANGIKGFLMKPLTKSEIGKTVRKVLDDKKTA